MKSRYLTLALLVLAAASLLWGWTRIHVSVPPDTPESGHTAEDEDVNALIEEVTRLQTENQELRDRLIAAESRPSESGPAAHVEPAAEEKPVDLALPFESVLDNEETKQEVRSLLRQQQEAFVRRSVEKDYEGLLLGPEIRPDDRDTLMELLTQRGLAEIMAPLDLFFEQGTEFDPQQMQVAHGRQQEAAEAMDDEIRALLSPKAYGAYEYYRETIGARGEVKEIQQRLAAHGIALTEDQEKAMVGIVYLEQAEEDSLGDANPADQVELLFSDAEGYAATMDQALDQTANMYNRILDASRDTLSEAQVEALRAHYQDRLAEQEHQAGITGAMAPLFRDLMEREVGE